MKKEIGTIKITKKLFIEIISDIENQYKHDDKCHEAFKVILPNDFITGYNYDLIINRLMKLLLTAFNDYNKDSWIEYFIWELDFGKNYKVGSVTNKDGSEIDLSTSDKLYDFLIENNKKK